MLFSFSLFIRRRAMAVVSLSLLAVAASAQEPFGSSHINDDDSHTDSVPSAFQNKLMNEAYTPEFSVPMPESRFTRSTFSRMMSSVQPPKPKFHVDSIDRLMLYGTPEPKFTASPYAYDFNRSGVVTSWKNGFLMGYGSRTTMPVLMSNQNVSFSAVQNVGNFTFTGGVSADRYFMWRNTRTMFGFNGSVTYNFSDNVRQRCLAVITQASRITQWEPCLIWGRVDMAVSLVLWAIRSAWMSVLNAITTRLPAVGLRRPS